jgi:hypothetical protein
MEERLITFNLFLEWLLTQDLDQNFAVPDVLPSNVEEYIGIHYYDHVQEKIKRKKPVPINYPDRFRIVEVCYWDVVKSEEYKSLQLWDSDEIHLTRETYGDYEIVNTPAWLEEFGLVLNTVDYLNIKGCFSGWWVLRIFDEMEDLMDLYEAFEFYVEPDPVKYTYEELVGGMNIGPLFKKYG